MDVDHQLILGLPIAAIALPDALELCDEAIATDGRVQWGVVNAAKMVRMRKDRALRESLLRCDYVLADGQSVVWASRFLRRALPERVAGIDLFERLLEKAEADGRSVYLLGATQQTLDGLLERLAQRFPALILAGARDGYFAPGQAAAVAAEIRASKPDMVFLGMSSPKKEVFLADYGDALGAAVLHGVGGSFDVLAGVTARAPRRWQRAGLEWLYRLLQEPRRLAGRYLSTNAVFIALVVKERFRATPRYVGADR